MDKTSTTTIGYDIWNGEVLETKKYSTSTNRGRQFKPQLNYQALTYGGRHFNPNQAIQYLQTGGDTLNPNQMA